MQAIHKTLSRTCNVLLSSSLLRSNRITLQTPAYRVFNHAIWPIKTRHSHSLCSNIFNEGNLHSLLFVISALGASFSPLLRSPSRLWQMGYTQASRFTVRKVKKPLHIRHNRASNITQRKSLNDEQYWVAVILFLRFLTFSRNKLYYFYAFKKYPEKLWFSCWHGALNCKVGVPLFLCISKPWSHLQ